jgi:hypothetical protein
MLTAISARADIPEATLAKLFGSPYVKVERRGSVITRITFSKFEDHNFHGGECYSLILEVLRGSDGAELNGDSIPGVMQSQHRRRHAMRLNSCPSRQNDDGGALGSTATTATLALGKGDPEKHSPVQSSRSLNRGNHFHV